MISNIKLNGLLAWASETGATLHDIENELEYAGIDLTTDEFLQLLKGIKQNES